MVAFGDADKDVWLTEFGYSTTTQDGGVSAATQAAFLVKAYRYVERFPWVKTLFWYAARNSPFYADADELRGRFGLATTGWGLKQSYWALRAYALDLPDRPRRAPQGAAAHCPPGQAAAGSRSAGGRPPAAAWLSRAGAALPLVLVQRQDAARLGHRRPHAHQLVRRLQREGRRARKPPCATAPSPASTTACARGSCASRVR